MMRREFVLTDGDRYIRRDINGRYIRIGTLSLADTYNTRKEANNVLHNSISRAISRKFFVAEIIDGKIVGEKPTDRKLVLPRCEGKAYRYEDNLIDSKWINKFDGLDEIFTEAEKREKELPQEILNIEACITDLEHYIEFTSLNARDGYKACKKLSDMLRQRRKLKNEKEIVGAICRGLSAKPQIENILSAIKKCSNKAYKPRVLSELFDNGIVSIGEAEK